MKDFNTKRFFLAVLAVFVVSGLLDYVIHGLILGSAYESLEGVWREKEDMESMMWIMNVTGVVFALVFVYIFHFFKKGHFKTGYVTGLCYGFLVGIIIHGVGAFNQHAIYNVPSSMAWKWVFFGIIQMVILGVVASLIYKPKD